MQRLITQKAAAELLGISPKTLWLWTNNGLIPYIRLPGTRIKYDLSDLDQLITDNKHTTKIKSPNPTII
jgi:excisionase family DNA binding protein